MTFETFQKAIVAAMKRSGESATAVFMSVDGKYIADLSSGQRFVGNPRANRVEVQWGSGHRAYANVSQFMGNLT